ncbi:MAG: hypothetical protein IJZ79_03315 [Bacilli bacterium]|nr:hypothetical protein [Bacilli bacterium]MBQ8218757.1 hypothetical protein [Bacilli bacterium]
MLLIIETLSRTCIAKINDASYESVSKVFEMIGRPELTISGIRENDSLKLNEEYDLHDWDDVATVMTEQHKASLLDVNLEDVECIGTVKILEDDYVWVNGEIEE